MRPDMQKVIVSRPRTGGSKRKATKHGGREPMRPRGYDTKQQTDLFGPLRKFLRSHLGQNWNDVWSEICANADGRSTLGAHLRRHVDEMVERPRLGDDGQLYSQYGTVFDTNSPYRRGFYLDPRTNQLCEIQRIKTPKGKEPSKVLESDGQYYLNHDGIWFRVKMVEIKAQVWDGRWSPSIHDEFLDLTIAAKAPSHNWYNYWLQERLKEKYGLSPNKLYWHCVDKQSANHREIKKLS